MTKSPPAESRPPPAVVPMARGEARASLALYLGLVVVLTLPLEGWMILDGRPLGDLPFWSIMALMWVPAVAGVATRLVRRERFADLGLRPGGVRGLKWLAIVTLLPLGVGLVAYVPAWTFGLARGPLRPDELGGSAYAALAVRAAIVVPLGTAFGLLSATGEELGWRGTMLNRLVDARVPRPVLVSGLIWGLWHAPLILSGQYTAGSSRLASAVLFMITVVAASVIMARVQWRTGSVWHACVYHAAWNATIQGVFDQSTELTDAAEVWVGESGLLVVAAELVLAVILWLALGPWRLRRHPQLEPEPLPGLP